MSVTIVVYDVNIYIYIYILIDINNGHEMLGTWSTTCHRVSDSHLRPRQPVWPETEYQPSFVNCRLFILFV